MRKLISVVLLCSTIAVLAACGKKENTPQTPTTAPTLTPTEEPTVPPTEAPTQTPDVSEDTSSALSILTEVFNEYTEDEMFPAIGGDFDHGNNVKGAPGKYDISDGEILFNVFGFPKDKLGLIEDAASLQHMMNANTFTSGAFHVTDSASVSVLADAIKENIEKRQWLCGFPDKLVIVGTSDYVVSAFGAQELIDIYKSKLLATFSTASVLYEINLME